MPHNTETKGGGGVVGVVERHPRVNGEREEAGRGGEEGLLALRLTLSAVDPEVAELRTERSFEAEFAL
jgi:hypothetical protein